MTAETQGRRANLTSEAAIAAVLKSLGARAATLPISTAASVATIRILIERFGAEGYALYALIATLPLILPVADLGLGAAVTDVVARRHVVGDDAVRAVVGGVLARLLVVGGVLSAAGLALGATGRWRWILGVTQDVAGVERAATLALVTFGASVPLGVGLAVLLGAGLNHQLVVLQAGTTVLVLCLVGVAALAKGPLWIFPATSGTALAATGALSLVVASRRGLLPRGALVIRWRLANHHELWQLALPMLVLMVALPATYHTARLVLSHESTLAEVAAYSLMFQLYAPVVSLVTAAGRSLWPAFASRRDVGAPTRAQLSRLTTLFAVGGLMLALPFAVLASWAGDLLSGGAVDIRVWLAAAFGGLVWVQAVQYPSGMLLTDPQGLRFQAGCSVLMAATALVLSIGLASSWGAVGPVVATLVGFVGFLAVPSMLRARASVRGDPAQR